MNKKNIILLFLLTTLLSGCTQGLWLTNNFNAIKSDIDTVSIILPHVEYTIINGETRTTNNAYGMFISINVAAVLKEVIAEGNFISKSAINMCDTTIINDWLSQNFINSTKNYHHIVDSLRRSKNEERIFPLTPELQLLVDQVKSRHFIFVEGVAFGTTEDSKRFDLLQAETFKLFYDRPYIYDFQWSGLQLRILLIETKSKKVLWSNYNTNKDSKYNPLKNQGIKDLCTKLLKGK
jgi:hypothetical protein